MALQYRHGRLGQLVVLNGAQHVVRGGDALGAAEEIPGAGVSLGHLRGRRAATAASTGRERKDCARRVDTSCDTGTDAGDGAGQA